MGTSFLFVVLVMFCVTACPAQILLDEPFDVPDVQRWFIGDRGSIAGTIAKGVYTLEGKSAGVSQIVTTGVTIPPGHEWSIRLVIRRELGTRGNSWGLVYNTVDVRNRYQLSLLNTGLGIMARRRNGTNETIGTARLLDVLHDGDGWDTLEVLHKGDAITGYVNGRSVASYTASMYTVDSTAVGIFVDGTDVVAVDRLTVAAWPADTIRVVAGADTLQRATYLGPGVNTPTEELVDAISADGRTLFFSRNGHKGNAGAAMERDIWKSVRDSITGSWSEAVNLGPPVNTDHEDYAVAVSQDMSTLYLQGSYGDDDAPLSVSYAERNGWATPVPMEIDDYYTSGTVANSHVSADQRVLVISLCRNDGMGANDLYVCFRKDATSWTAPVHMGTTLNTAGMDHAPFIAPDGETLYFSSNGHAGYGGYDIFVSRRLDSTWRQWSAPENLGKAINSTRHESFFQVSARGDSAYFSTRREGQAYDIASLALPKAARPIPTVLVRGRVLNAMTREPLAAEVFYERLTDGEALGQVHTLPEDGQFRLLLARGENYGVRAQAVGYYPVAERVDLSALGEYREQIQDLLLMPVTKNVVVTLNNVFFDVGSGMLRAESYPELDRLVMFLQDQPGVGIELAGHTDDVGADADNLALSQNRVNSVRQYLEAKGVNAVRVVATGYGESRPMVPNTSDANRQKNRRVEFRIVDR